MINGLHCEFSLKPPHILLEVEVIGCLQGLSSHFKLEAPPFPPVIASATGTDYLLSS